MIFFGIVLLNVLAINLAQKDESKWVWNQSKRGQQGRSYSDNFDPRYEVNENDYDYKPEGTGYYPNQGPIYENFKPDYQRPNGLYNGPNRPNYGQGGYLENNYPEESHPGILTGPVPSWVPQGPIKDFDKCKCTEKFNCNSPGISYGHCDVGKQYCCHATKKDGIIGGPIPSRPVHSLENGVLVGPGGLIDPIPAPYPRPPIRQNGINGFVRPGNGYGLKGGHGNRYGQRRPDQNIYSAENGVLVGPGGPYDGPYGRQV